MRETSSTGSRGLARRAAPVVAALTAALLAPAAVSAAPGTETTPAGAQYDADRVIVKYRQGVGPGQRRPLEHRAGVERTVDELSGLGAEVVEVEGDPLRAAGRLEDSPKVAYAEPDFVMSAQSRRPNDTAFRSLWGLHNRGQTGGTPGADVAALAGWRRAGVGGFPSGGGVRVAVIDTGIYSNHPDLRGKVVACANKRTEDLIKACRDDVGHGTHVAGTLAAVADNGIGVAGVAFNSPLLDCRALGGLGHDGFVSDVAECMDWARRQGARVISMSFAGPPTETLRRAVNRAWANGSRSGAVLVAAAGNHDGYSAQYPAAYDQVISSTATNHRDRYARFSNRHRTVELSAPGVGTRSTWRDGGYQRTSGTSMAVPHIAGVAAQLRTLRPRLRAARIRREMRRSAVDRGARGRDPRYGFGRVDLARGVNRLR